MSTQDRPSLAPSLLKVLSLPGVLAVRDGERWRGGMPTGQRAIVVTVEDKLPPDRVPGGEDIGGVLSPQLADVQQASPLQVIFSQPKRFGVTPTDLQALEDRLGYPFVADSLGISQMSEKPSKVAASGRYTPPPGESLGPISGSIKLRCHSGPDAGWKELKAFIGRIERELIVGMYDFTAPHIGDALLARLADRGRTFSIILDPKEALEGEVKAGDRKEDEHMAMFASAMGSRFDHAWASISPSSGTFPYAYHIKLAVRDEKEFWLSSGSWQSTNQPELDPLGADRGNIDIDQYNREWHVIAAHADLARRLKAYLLWDLKTAHGKEKKVSAAATSIDLFVAKPTFHYSRFFEPAEFDLGAARVSALLTPDNYIEAAMALVESAQHSLLVQNQSLSFLKKEEDQDERYTRFIRLLAEKSRSLQDFKMIVRDPREFFGNVADTREIYRAKGFNVDRIQFQVHCHNKGVIADGRRLMLGSHNITNSGLTANRDASVIIESEAVCAYYQQIFDHDWSECVLHKADIPVPRLAAPGEFAPPGMVRVSLGAALANLGL